MNSFNNAFLPSALFKTSKNHTPHIIAVGGGKGGVGKSSIAMMMALYLAESGRETVLVDADLTGANLHGYLRVCDNGHTIHTFLKNTRYTIRDLLVPTSFKNLSAIIGSLGMKGAENYRTNDVRRLLQGLSDLPVEYVILDLGAEGSAVEIDLFLSAQTGLTVSSSDSFSLHNVFNFVRSALLRKIRKQWRGQDDMLEKLISYISESDMGGSLSLEQAFKKWGYDSGWVRQAAATLRPKILINMVEDNESAESLQALRVSVSQLLSMRLDYWGVVHNDRHVRQAIRGFDPAQLHSQENRAFSDIRRIVDRQLLKPAPIPIMLTAQQIQAKKQIVKNFLHGTLCSTRCLAWRSCSLKQGGLPCAMKPLDVLRREACYV